MKNLIKSYNDENILLFKKYISKILNIDYSIYYRKKIVKFLDNNILPKNNVKVRKLKFDKDNQDRFLEFIELSEKKFKINFENFYKTDYWSDINFSKSTYHKYLTSEKNLNYSYKKITKYTIYNNDSPKKLNLRKNFIEEYLKLQKLGFNFIKIDEFGMSEFLHPNYGWDSKGKKLMARKNISKTYNCSVICVITDYTSWLK